MIRLREIREAKGLTLTEFSKLLNIDKAALSRIENGFRDPKADFLKACSKTLNITIDEILGLTDNAKNMSGKLNLIQIPLYNDFNFQSFMNPNKSSSEFLSIESTSIHDRSLFALRMSISSIEPCINPGDIVIIKRQEKLKSGEFAALLFMNKELVLRVVHLSSTGITVQAYKDQITAQFFNKEEIETLPIQILGKIIELRHLYITK